MHKPAGSGMGKQELPSRTKLVLITGLFFLIGTSSAPGQTRPGIRPFVDPPEDCYVSEAIEPENVYSYLRVQIQALSLAQKGDTANILLAADGNAPVGREANTIAGLRTDLIQNTCASFVISYYADSKNQIVAATAKQLASAYEELGEMSNQMLGITLQKSLQRVFGPSPQLQFSRLMDERRKIMERMTKALEQSLALLIDGNRRNEEGKLDHLVLRKAQVKELLDYVNEHFPMLADNKYAPSGGFVEQAALIRMFLTGGFRPADLP